VWFLYELERGDPELRVVGCTVKPVGFRSRTVDYCSSFVLRPWESCARDLEDWVQLPEPLYFYIFLLTFNM